MISFSKTTEEKYSGLTGYVQDRIYFLEDSRTSEAQPEMTTVHLEMMALMLRRSRQEELDSLS